VHDQRFADLARGADVGTKTRLLQVGVLGAVVIVETGFTDGNDQRVPRQCGQLLHRRLDAVGLVRVHAHRGRDLRVPCCQAAHHRRVGQAHAHAQQMPDILRRGIPEQGVDGGQIGINQVQVAVRIDQHGYMVWV
jgi:hypothetical protein